MNPLTALVIAPASVARTKAEVEADLEVAMDSVTDPTGTTGPFGFQVGVRRWGDPLGNDWLFGAGTGGPQRWSASSASKVWNCCASLYQQALGNVSPTTPVNTYMPLFPANVEFQHTYGYNTGFQYVGGSANNCRLSSANYADFVTCVSDIPNAATFIGAPGTDGSVSYDTINLDVKTVVATAASGGADYQTGVWDVFAAAHGFTDVTLNGIGVGSDTVNTTCTNFFDLFDMIRLGAQGLGFNGNPPFLTQQICQDFFVDGWPFISSVVGATTGAWFGEFHKWVKSGGLWAEQRSATWDPLATLVRFAAVGSAGQYALLDFEKQMTIVFGFSQNGFTTFPPGGQGWFRQFEALFTELAGATL